MPKPDPATVRDVLTGAGMLTDKRPTKANLARVLDVHRSQVTRWCKGEEGALKERQLLIQKLAWLAEAREVRGLKEGEGSPRIRTDPQHFESDLCDAMTRASMEAVGTFDEFAERQISRDHFIQDLWFLVRRLRDMKKEAELYDVYFEVCSVQSKLSGILGKLESSTTHSDF